MWSTDTCSGCPECAVAVPQQAQMMQQPPYYEEGNASDVKVHVIVRASSSAPTVTVLVVIEMMILIFWYSQSYRLHGYRVQVVGAVGKYSKQIDCVRKLGLLAFRVLFWSVVYVSCVVRYALWDFEMNCTRTIFDYALYFYRPPNGWAWYCVLSSRNQCCFM